MALSPSGSWELKLSTTEDTEDMEKNPGRYLLLAGRSRNAVPSQRQCAQPYTRRGEDRVPDRGSDADDRGLAGAGRRNVAPIEEYDLDRRGGAGRADPGVR